MKANVSISRRQGHENYIAITIKDEASGLRVCEVAMDFDEFSQCITGLANSKGTFAFINTPEIATNFGKTKVVEDVQCERAKSVDKEAQRAIVAQHFTENYSGDWKIWSDGTTSQQRGEMHNYSVYRYEESADEVTK